MLKEVWIEYGGGEVGEIFQTFLDFLFLRSDQIDH